MKVMVVGSGAREHAISWALSKSDLVGHLIAAPGNPGIGALAELKPVEAEDVDGLVRLASETAADLVVVGPEAPLVGGLADRLRSQQIAVFGPSAGPARMEGSKAFAKEVMRRCAIPTANAASFDDPDEALSYARSMPGGLVVKADGLAAGKGVTICEDIEAAERAIDEAMRDRRFGDAGATVLIEELMAGEELSVIALSDGKSVLPLIAAQDYKRLYDEDRGPNTGGMGSYSPVPSATEEVMRFALDSIIEPIIAAMAEDGTPYVGALYAGLMLTEQGPKVVEFNCRFGDPETQALLPLLETDLASLMMASATAGLAGMTTEWSDESCVSVVVAADGYPTAAVTGQAITGLDAAASVTGLPVFHASTAASKGKVMTAGGRVASVSATGSNIAEARERAYKGLSQIHFEGMRFRTDIAARAI